MVSRNTTVLADAAGFDEELRALIQRRDWDAATHRLIEEFGVEIRRFVATQLKNPADTWDVFSLFCEDVWRGLPTFEARCSARAWAYTLARHAVCRYRMLPARRLERNVSLSSRVFETMARARTLTAPYRRTEVKHRFRELRASLSEEDQLILILRVDRRMGWAEIAQVLGAQGTCSELEREREAARLRKRFQLVKSRLRLMALERGLLNADPSG